MTSQNNVVALPDTMHRQWRVFESVLRDWLKSSMGCTPDEIDHACEQLKPFYLRFAQPKAISRDDPEKFLAELNEWVQSQISGLLQLVAVRDVELYRLRGGDDQP